MKDKTQSAISVVLLALVVTAVFVPYFGSMTAMGATDSEDCSFMDTQNTWVQVLASAPVEPVDYTFCIAGDLLEDSDVSGLSESEAQQTLHAKSASVSALEDNQLASRHNYLTDYRWIAMSDARIAGAKAIDNHKTQTEAIYKARQKVASDYARLENNSVTIQSGQIERIRSIYSVKRTENITYNISVSIHHTNDTGTYQYGHDLRSYDRIEFVNSTTTLADGSTVNVTRIKVVNATVYQQTSTGDSKCYSGNFTSSYDGDGIDAIESNCSYDDGVSNLQLIAQAPESYNDDLEIYDGAEWKDHYSNINSSHAYVNNNIEKQIETLYNKLSASEIDGQDLLYASDVARQSAGSYARTGSLASFTAWASMRGYKVNTTSVMTVEHTPALANESTTATNTTSYTDQHSLDEGTVKEVVVTLDSVDANTTIAYRTADGTEITNKTVSSNGTYSLDLSSYSINTSNKYEVHITSTSGFAVKEYTVYGDKHQHEGMLFTRATPSTTNSNGEPVWMANETYHADNYSDPLYFAIQDSEKVRTATLDGKITVKKIVNPNTGNTVKYSNPEHTTYRNASYTDVKEQNQDMQYVLKVSDQDTSTGAVISNMFGFLPGDIPWKWVAVAGIIIGLLLALGIGKAYLKFIIPFY